MSLRALARVSRQVDEAVRFPETRSPSSGRGWTVTTNPAAKAARRSSTYFSRLTKLPPARSKAVVTHAERNSASAPTFFEVKAAATPSATCSGVRGGRGGGTAARAAATLVAVRKSDHVVTET